MRSCQGGDDGLCDAEREVPEYQATEEWEGRSVPPDSPEAEQQGLADPGHEAHEPQAHTKDLSGAEDIAKWVQREPAEPSA